MSWLKRIFRRWWRRGGMLPQVRVPEGEVAGWVLTRSPNVIQVALPPGANGLRELRVAVRASGAWSRGAMRRGCGFRPGCWRC